MGFFPQDFVTSPIALLRSLHWLPVKYRVHFKICLLIYKTLHKEQPVWLHSLIAISLSSRSLRSNREITPSIPRIKTNTGARAFSLWCSFSLEQPSTICPCSHLGCHLDVSRHTFSTWPFPRRHRCAQRPVDVTE